MGLDLDPAAGQTPLDDDERADLRITTIGTRGELDEFEQIGVEQALVWTMATRPDTNRIGRGKSRDPPGPGFELLAQGCQRLAGGFRRSS